MSRQNKVNPGMYTQRGRLSQDDAARELRKQNVIASSHTWQPVHTQMRQRPAPAGDTARDTVTSADSEMTVETPPQVKPRPKSRATTKMAATKSARAAAPSNVKGKATKAKTAETRKSGTAMRRKTTKPTRKAARAQTAGGRGTTPRRSRQRRKS